MEFLAAHLRTSRRHEFDNNNITIDGHANRVTRRVRH